MLPCWKWIDLARLLGIPLAKAFQRALATTVQALWDGSLLFPSWLLGRRNDDETALDGNQRSLVFLVPGCPPGWRCKPLALDDGLDELREFFLSEAISDLADASSASSEAKRVSNASHCVAGIVIVEPSMPYVAAEICPSGEDPFSGA